jgi:hypothetical protein
MQSLLALNNVFNHNFLSFLTLMDGMTLSNTSKALRRRIYEEQRHLVVQWILRPMLLLWLDPSKQGDWIDDLAILPKVEGISHADKYIQQYRRLRNENVLSENSYLHLIHFAKQKSRNELLAHKGLEINLVNQTNPDLRNMVRLGHFVLLRKLASGRIPLYISLAESQSLLDTIYRYSLGLLRYYWKINNPRQKIIIRMLLPPWIQKLHDMTNRRNEPRLNRMHHALCRQIVENTQCWLKKGTRRCVKKSIYIADVKKTSILWNIEETLYQSVMCHLLPPIQGYSKIYDRFIRAARTSNKMVINSRAENINIFDNEVLFGIPNLRLVLTNLEYVQILEDRDELAKAYIDKQGYLFTSKAFSHSARTIVDLLNSDNITEIVSTIGIVTDHCVLCSQLLKSKIAREYGYDMKCGHNWGLPIKTLSKKRKLA